MKSHSINNFLESNKEILLETNVLLYCNVDLLGDYCNILGKIYKIIKRRFWNKVNKLHNKTMDNVIESFIIATNDGKYWKINSLRQHYSVTA